MNTQATPAKAERLTEEEVHSVCARLIQSGQKATIVNVFNELKRGSMTTIKKFIDTFNDDLTPEEQGAELQLDLSDPTVTTALNHFLAIVTKKAIDNSRAGLEAELAKMKEENEKLKAELLDCQSFCENLENIIETLEQAAEEKDRHAQNLELSLKKQTGKYHELELKHSAASAKLEVYEAIGGTSTKTEEPTKKPAQKKKEKVSESEPEQLEELIEKAKNTLEEIQKPKKTAYLKISVKDEANDKILVEAPYCESFLARMHKLNAEWKPEIKAWELSKLTENSVRKELINIFSVDDSEKADLCSIRLKTKEGFYKGKAPITIAGRIVAEAKGRDTGATTKGTIVLNSEFRSTGSMKNWATEAMPETEIVLEGFFTNAIELINETNWEIMEVTKYEV